MLALQGQAHYHLHQQIHLLLVHQVQLEISIKPFSILPLPIVLCGQLRMYGFPDLQHKQEPSKLQELGDDSLSDYHSLYLPRVDSPAHCVLLPQGLHY